MYIIATFTHLLNQILLVNHAQLFGAIYISNLLAHIKNYRE